MIRGGTSLKLMALRTLVFSSDQQAAQVLAQHLAEFDLEAILCPNIFSALENVGRVRLDGVIADWNDDPEASFLIKRLRETDLNRKAMVLAVVKDESEVARAYDAGAKAVLFRPLESGEIREAFTKARPFMLERATSGRPDSSSVASVTPPPPAALGSGADDVMPLASPMAQVFAGGSQTEPPAFDQQTATGATPARVGYRVPWKTLVAALLILAAVPLLIRLGSSIKPLRTTVRSAMDAAMGMSDEPPARPAMDESLDTAGVSNSPSGNVRVVMSVGVLYDAVAHLPLQKEALPDFPLQVEKLNIAPPPVVRAAIPDSIRRSAPIDSGHPVEARPTPAMLDVVEPVSISEDAARGLLEHSVDPAYPQDAVHSGIQGAVVLQAVIGRDGTVRDLRLMDGYFVLGRAALQAVKQWHFRPYVVNGRAVETQTILTFNFRLPVVSGVSQTTGEQ